jgi:hypothetical protein
MYHVFKPLMCIRLANEDFERKKGSEKSKKKKVMTELKGCTSQYARPCGIRYETPTALVPIFQVSSCLVPGGSHPALL